MTGWFYLKYTGNPEKGIRKGKIFFTTKQRVRPSENSCVSDENSVRNFAQNEKSPTSVGPFLLEK